MAIYKDISRNIIILGICIFGGTQNVLSIPPPSPKPATVFYSNILSEIDIEYVTRAFWAAEDNNWQDFTYHHNRVSHPAANKLLLWYVMTRFPRIQSFDAGVNALDKLDGWIEYKKIQARTEDAIWNSDLEHEKRIDWLQSINLVSGVGKLALANSLQKLDRKNEAGKYIRDAWLNHYLSREYTNQVLHQYSQDFSNADYLARTEYLIWTGQWSSAQHLLPYINSDDRKVISARLALARKHRGVDAAIKAVPQSLQSDPGLLYERARWRRQKRHAFDRYLPLLRDIDMMATPESGRKRIWRERHIAVRKLIEKNDYKTAYELCKNTGLTSGTEFAQSEWLAGWLALRKLSDPIRALPHFQRLAANVGTPISKSRAYYWLGQTQIELENRALANENFRLASEYKYTFYGQLAAEKLGETMMVLPEPVTITDLDRKNFFEREQVQVLSILIELGEDYLFRRFALHLAKQLESRLEQALLFELLVNYNHRHIGLRAAKLASANGNTVSEAAYPLVEYEPVIQFSTRVEQALILALSRQESELNPRAISPKGARGLMQFMPATAHSTAQSIGLRYRTSWLVDDPSYNLTLGYAHLNHLMKTFDGSLPMVIAAYNAGAHRVKQWMITYGDPRNPEIDMIDWIEHIPFSETRNYVQRVMENLQVYRHRLSEKPEHITLLADLNFSAYEANSVSHSGSSH